MRLRVTSHSDPYPRSCREPRRASPQRPTDRSALCALHQPDLSRTTSTQPACLHGLPAAFGIARTPQTTQPAWAGCETDHLLSESGGIAGYVSSTMRRRLITLTVAPCASRGVNSEARSKEFALPSKGRRHALVNNPCGVARRKDLQRQKQKPAGYNQAGFERKKPNLPGFDQMCAVLVNTPPQCPRCCPSPFCGANLPGHTSSAWQS